MIRQELQIARNVFAILMKDAGRQIGIGEEDDDGKISRHGDCRRVIACGFGTELCRQADVRHEDCEIAISRGRVTRFSDLPVQPSL
jgi:hypothetical protein